MKILLLGCNGQLGQELQRCLPTLGPVTALDWPQIDLAQPAFIAQVRAAQPEIIINAAAYTAVDQAESEPEQTEAINGQAPRLLAEAACELHAALIHYSTDYVFDGCLGRAYVETDAPHPLNVYGRSKLAGEQAVQQVGGAYLILRTSWVYSRRGDSFVNKVLRWARQQRRLRIVSDQVGSPTWARALAETTAALLAQAPKAGAAAWLGERGGLYHLAGAGQASRLEWAQATLRLDPRRTEQVATALEPAQTSEFPTPAQRPLYTPLDCDCFAATFGLRLPPWEAALAQALAEPLEN
jgi:dTDP-4-dehydrorhamnose reductase